MCYNNQIIRNLILHKLHGLFHLHLFWKCHLIGHHFLLFCCPSFVSLYLFSTTDHLHALNQLIEKANEYQLKLSVGYIDYEKAFDSVQHSACSDLSTALRKIGVSEGYVHIMEDIYTNATATIHLDKDVSKRTKPIHLNRDVREGDTISPKIFTASTEE